MMLTHLIFVGDHYNRTGRIYQHQRVDSIVVQAVQLVVRQTPDGQADLNRIEGRVQVRLGNKYSARVTSPCQIQEARCRCSPYDRLDHDLQREAAEDDVNRSRDKREMRVADKSPSITGRSDSSLISMKATPASRDYSIQKDHTILHHQGWDPLSTTQ